MLASTWDENNCMCFLQPHSTPFVDELTLCLLKMTFAFYLTLSLPTQHEWIYFPDLVQLKDLPPPMQFKPMKGAIATNTPLINSSLEQLRYLVAYTNMLMCFYMIWTIWSLKGLEGPHISTLVTFLCQILFDHITNDANVFHLKLGGSCRLDHFFTSTPSKHTFHHHS